MLQTKSLTLAGSPVAHLTEFQSYLALLAISYDAPGQKSPWKGGGGGITYDKLFLKPGHHHHLVKMFYTSSKIILNVTSVH